MNIPARQAGSGRSKILLIEADLASRDYVEALLDGGQYDIEFAADCQTGLEQARKINPDAVILGIALPDMDGAEMVLSLRSDSLTSRAVVFLLGEQGDAKKAQRAMEIGADDYLVKPFHAQELQIRLQARIRQRRTFWRPDEQKALLDLTRLMASSLDMQELLHLVVVRTAELLHVDRCSMVLTSPEKDRATVIAASENADLQGIQVSLANYPEILEVLRTRKPFVVERVESHPKLRGILPTLVSKGVGSLALFPMMHEDQIDGVLFLRSERFGHVLGERDIFFANAVAAAVTLALRNLQAMESERRITAELQRTKNFLENLIDSSVDAIIAADLKGNIILFNKGAERIFGYRAREVIGKLHVTKLYPADGAREVMDLLKREGSGGPGRLSTIRKEVFNKDGDIVPIHLTAWCVEEGDSVVATAGIFTDLRERLKIERKLSQAQEKLLHNEQQVMIAELAGATAHELNQPLTSMLGYAELAKRKLEKPEEIVRILNIILSEAERMADIIRKIGRITRYETKSYVGEQRIVDIDRSSEPERDP
ncbi:MAG TPA: PAS domain S-box protein [Myxococcota bacterium]|nr:PAS domain S-box protein [Myxococcota bacterium]